LDEGQVVVIKVADMPTVEATPVDSTPPAIQLIGVSKCFNEGWAVQPTDLTIGRNEFFSILGPSGCGKTTLMRMIAGFETPSDGAVLLDGNDVRDQPTRKRDLNMLFQSYALFPHLDVYDNVAFELKVRYGRRGKNLPASFAGESLDSIVRRALSLVRMDDFVNRKPDQLSGGQRQRVALARAIVSNPSVVLLDEPLGALDQQLRKQMQFELTRLQREVGITFVYVTHDQEEALTMSDRIAVMNAGVVQQIGTPREIYEEPVNAFVARFIGTCNLLPVNVISDPNGSLIVSIDGVGPAPAPDAADMEGADLELAVRPEMVSVAAYPEGDGWLAATLVDKVYLGNQWLLRMSVGDHPLTASITILPEELESAAAGAPVYVTWPAHRARLVTKD
jgi:ABC-type Fe3+/spermidine/putrescine transport system ATPase subunit